jgi:small subunit ribosomal protein S3
MGQKINAIGLRLGINKTWDSRWFSSKNYVQFLHQDIAIRHHVKKLFSQAGIAKVIVERPSKKVIVAIHAARPGVLIGKKGTDLEKLKKQLEKLVANEVAINIVEVRKPDLDAVLIAQSISEQIEKRVTFRRAMKKGMQNALRSGALGIRVNCSGRLGGAEIARMEWYREGRVPLHTLRSDIDYGLSEAKTTYGICGIKVWIYKGEILDSKSHQVDHKG